MLFASFWQIIISIVLLISVFITPFNLAFETYQTTMANYGVFLNVIDGLFYVDIFINFFIVLDKDDGTFEDNYK